MRTADIHTCSDLHLNIERENKISNNNDIGQWCWETGLVLLKIRNHNIPFSKIQFNSKLSKILKLNQILKNEKKKNYII